MEWLVYILKCSDDSFYVGFTSNLAKRLARHNARQVNYTSQRLPIKVVTIICFSDKYKAIDFEKYLKSGSGRAFMSRRLI